MKINNFKYLLLASLAFVACSEEIEEETVAEAVPTAGTANFSKFVALGNSITAGYTDGALFKAGQANSFAKLLADQFKTVGGGDFKTPFMNDNLGGLLAGGVQIQGTRLVFNGCSPVSLTGVPTTEIGIPLAGGPFNNLGVPGAKSFHLLAPNYGNIAGLLNGTANPYFVRFRSAAATSILADALAQNPTFFSLWIGNNDVLSYATSGGTGLNQTGNPNPATYGPNDITDPTLFANVYNALLDGTNGLTKNGAKGVVANIPDVSALPFFTTINVKPIAPYTYFLDSNETDCRKTDYPASANDIATIDQLNVFYSTLKNLLTAAGVGDRVELLSKTSNNPLLINDESLPSKALEITAAANNIPQLAPLATYLGATYGRARQTKAGDLIPLTTRASIGATITLPPGVPANYGKNGFTFPMEDRFVLVPSEITEIKNATTSYNNTIKNIAASKGLAFVDANALMNQVASTGIRFGTFSMNSSLVTGGTFGLDGIHLTPRANALAANKFMEAISATYGAKFNMYNLSLYPLNYPTILAN